MAKSGMIVGGLAIVALVGAVAVMAQNGGFMPRLSSVETPSVEPAQTRTRSAAPVPQPEVTQPGAIEPVPAPSGAQRPPPAPPASASNDSAPDANTAQAGARVTAEDVLVPDAANEGRRTALSAEEKDAVARGLKELGLTAGAATPSTQSQEAATAELNRKALADSVAAEARSKQLQAQNQR